VPAPGTGSCLGIREMRRRVSSIGLNVCLIRAYDAVVTTTRMSGSLFETKLIYDSVLATLGFLSVGELRATLFMCCSQRAVQEHGLRLACRHMY
jgi:hypothetical protein